GVVLVEVGPTGRTCDPQVIPLDATPIYAIEREAGDWEQDLEALREQYGADAARALVAFRVLYRPGEHDPDRIRKDLETLFPRWYRGEVMPATSPCSDSPDSLTAGPQDVLGTVQEYLRTRVGEDDPDREALLSLGEQLWQ